MIRFSGADHRRLKQQQWPGDKTRSSHLRGFLSWASVMTLSMVFALALMGVMTFIAAAMPRDLNPLLYLCLASRPPVQPDQLWQSWSLAPQVILPLAVFMGLYGWGLAASLRRPGAAAETSLVGPLCVMAGWLLLVIALVSPLCRMAATTATAHMLQHIILVAIAPALIALGSPLAVLRQGITAYWRPGPEEGREPRWARAVWQWLTMPATACLLYALAIWLSHVPGIYQAALTDATIHLLTLGLLLGISLLFWRTLIDGAVRPRHNEEGFASPVLMALFTLMHTGLLGALLTFSPRPWYPLFATRLNEWGLTPLEDQQLAGLIMWVPMGLIYLIAGLAVMAVVLMPSAEAGPNGK